MGNWHRTYQKGTFAATTGGDDGILRNVVMCQVGEAKGHGVSLDSEFISNLVQLGKEKGDLGIKARFGHPTMSDNSTGDGVGRYKNPRLSEDGKQAIADLHLSDYSAKSPRGNLKEYISARAKEDPDSFGSSIVFTPGGIYQRNDDGEKVYPDNEAFDNAGEVFEEIKALHGCDVVDEPAATEGMFNAKNSRLFAVRITDFLDSNPDIYSFLTKHPNVEEKVKDFLSKYETYKTDKMDILTNIKNKLGLSKPEATEVETVETNPGEDPGNDAQAEQNEILLALANQYETLSSTMPEMVDTLESFSNRLKVVEEKNNPEVDELKAEITSLKNELTEFKSLTKSTYEPPAAKHDFNGKNLEDWAEEKGYNIPPALQEKINNK